MGFTLRKNHLLIWSNQKNTIKLHFKLIPNTKVHLSITVNFCCLKMIWQVQNQCSSVLIKFVLSAVKNTEISRKVFKPSNLKNKNTRRYKSPISTFYARDFATDHGYVIE